MSLYELMSMFAALDKKALADRAMTEEEEEEAKQRWRDMNLPDVRV